MATWKSWLDQFRARSYGRKQALVLINGLAEQSESWYRNHRYWSRYFDVYAPNLLSFEGEALHRMIRANQPITVDYLVGQLHLFLDQFVQNPPYNLVSSSLGGKVVVEFAERYPHLVNRIVLLCPSGMGDIERLPIIDGLKRSDHESIVRSVFHRPRTVDKELLRYYKRSFTNRRWKLGFIRTVRGTNDHVVRPKLKLLKQPTLFIAGDNDRIVDPNEGERASKELPNGHFIRIPNCGHAPQIEKPWLINRLVVHFLTHPRPLTSRRYSQLMLTKSHRVVS
jgi:pimeloyl-ACP methyl ester carboxylesterase